MEREVVVAGLECRGGVDSHSARVEKACLRALSPE